MLEMLSLLVMVSIMGGSACDSLSVCALCNTVFFLVTGLLFDPTVIGLGLSFLGGLIIANYEIQLGDCHRLSLTISTESWYYGQQAVGKFYYAMIQSRICELSLPTQKLT